VSLRASVTVTSWSLCPSVSGAVGRAVRGSVGQSVSNLTGLSVGLVFPL
jgi:hypothetical protein